LKVTMSYKKEILLGFALALVAYVTLFMAVAPVATSVHAQTSPLFSITLLAPTSNAARRQYAAIIASSFQQVGIAATPFFVNFDQLVGRLFFTNAYFFNGSVDWSKVGLDFAHGGYDAGFIGWISFSPAPDTSFTNWRGDYADWAPNGNNYYFYNNSQANFLMNQIESTVNQTLQIKDIYQLQQIIQNDSPDPVIYYEQEVVARSPQIQDYGGVNTYSPFSWPDPQHVSGVSTINFAEAGNVFPGNTLCGAVVTTSCNSLYATYITNPLYGFLLEWNPVQGQFYLALANYVHVTPDGLTWTINFKPNNWADGVPVTSNDFVFAYEASFLPGSGSVSIGTYSSQLGNIAKFTYLNGTSVIVDNTNGASPVWWNVTAVDAHTFTVSLTHPYAFFNETYTPIAPVPLHYFQGFPVDQWASLPFSTCSGPDKFANGTTVMVNGAPVSGPFGNGPYVLTSCDTANNVFKEAANPNYWNASGLQSIGQFAVKNYNVQWINGAQAAIAAYSTGTVNQLDSEYGLAPFASQLQGIGANIIHAPGALEQEMGFNLFNPIWGTGTGTPLGQSNPSQAANAARDVRRAMSYLIPRQQIISNLLLGAAAPGLTLISPASGIFYDSNLQPDPYNPYIAKQYLASAGYNTGVSPFEQTSTPVTLSSYNVWGFPIALTGTFKNPVTGLAYNNSLVYLQTSPDNSTWTSVQSTTTSANGSFTFDWTPPTPGTWYYRYYFPGVTVPNFAPKTFSFEGTLTNSSGAPIDNILVIMQVSTDQQTWTNVGAWVTGSPLSDGQYLFDWLPNQPGVYYYRYNITGYYVPSSDIAAVQNLYGEAAPGDAYNSLISSHQISQVMSASLTPVSSVAFSSGNQLIASGQLPVVAPPSFSNTYSITTTPLSTALNSVLSSYPTSSQLSQAVSGLATQSSVSNLQTSINSLQGQLQTATYVGYGAIVIAIISIIVAILAVTRKK